MSAQRYTSTVALERLALGNCPECGEPASSHGGLGGHGCGLTDNGVAARVAQYQEDHSCDYCLGLRCPCSCTSDCGARPGLRSSYCPKAAGYVEYLRSTGLYSEDELARMEG